MKKYGADIDLMRFISPIVFVGTHEHEIEKRLPKSVQETWVLIECHMFMHANLLVRQIVSVSYHMTLFSQRPMGSLSYLYPAQDRPHKKQDIGNLTDRELGFYNSMVARK